MRHEAREIRKLREHDVRLEAQRAIESRFHVAREIDDVEAARAQLGCDGPGRRDPHFVTARDELSRELACAPGAVEPVARDAVQNAHAERSYVRRRKILPGRKNLGDSAAVSRVA